MKVLLRADASASQGTGHVMRVLTLAEELVAQGHDVHLATNESGVDWLESTIADSRVTRHIAQAHTLDASQVHDVQPDWLVVDSYEIPSQEISRLRDQVKVLAIVDGDARNIQADLYLDHNVGAENLPWPEEVGARMIAGTRFALIRRAIRDVRRAEPWVPLSDPPRILAFMGGSDPTGMIVRVAEAIAQTESALQGTIICAPAWREQVDALLASKPAIKVIAPTRELPALLETTDIAISAAGTSSWELCTLGIPSILIEVVDNQTQSLREMTARGLVIGLSPSEYPGAAIAGELARSVDELAQDSHRRQALSQTCLESFDGLGAQRVVKAMVALERES